MKQQKWEYQVDAKQGLGIGGLEEESYLNRKGEEGWQLGGVHVATSVKHTYYYWKRPIQQQTKEEEHGNNR